MEIDVEIFQMTVKEMTELQDFVREINSSVSEMMGEITQAVVYMVRAEKDFRADVGYRR